MIVLRHAFRVDGRRPQSPSGLLDLPQIFSLTAFLIARALLAYFNVFNVSSKR